MQKSESTKIGRGGMEEEQRASGSYLELGSLGPGLRRGR